MNNTTNAERYFTREELSSYDFSKVPRHVAIIPDGNRRFAQKSLKNTLFGHEQGAKASVDTLKACSDLGVKTITMYLFSTENWNRSVVEIKALEELIARFLMNELHTFMEEGMRFFTIGEVNKFSSSFQNTVEYVKEQTKDNKRGELVFALSYGGKNEIVRAVNKLIENGKKNITSDDIEQNLDTALFPPPDLLIRTSGEKRLSNFLLWQHAYSELYFTETLWPEFTPRHLLDAFLEYQKRQRRFGG